jgi:putative transposase
MEALREHGMLPSMSRPANPYDNATCESFLRTLKREEISANTYRDFEQLHQGLKEFIEQYYNRCRLHSALSYRSPEGFEKHVAETRPTAFGRGAMVTFFST